ncbi:hypothetical protein CAOG_04749 [Capsaspora owczarzaki ATCC 30864]|uniref:FAM86 N-terminal domain-containing protein n=1 Tax=Capsaspora owczarzaki (strain ATCC 30864) TaxID=595528 RepID=A0A0D2VSI1_CAPO3|nr:hypothetical protein CAOG_04749 [Capsaspora owczarzaki ATCC 30864]KJE94052.1 hypothetical protein CAOG_004749 [Capsaspora owczarzaki ATCC 30864]|eukprot:XP_004347500.1 hypothetical protein CAOG_04749 [Capsaspora owczarzaki ATCC 30864]
MATQTLSSVDHALALIRVQYMAGVPARLFHWPVAPVNPRTDTTTTTTATSDADGFVQAQIMATVGWSTQVGTSQRLPAWMLEVAVQRRMVAEIFQHPRCLSLPPSQAHAKSIAKYYYAQVEAARGDTCDELVSLCVELLNLNTSDAEAAAAGGGSDDWCHRTYDLGFPQAISTDPAALISMKESRNIISKGTTGLAGWPAAHYLAEWLLQHPSAVSGKKVMELGSGTGLVGIVAGTLRPKILIASDYDTHVLSCLRHNLDLNGVLAKGAELPARANATPALVEDLDWFRVTERSLQAFGAELVLAADVVYDPDLLDPLCKVLSGLLKVPSYRRIVPKAAPTAASGTTALAGDGSVQAPLPPVLTAGRPVALVASTIRNPDIIEQFKTTLKTHALEFTTLAELPPLRLFYDRSLPVLLLAITASSAAPAAAAAAAAAPTVAATST